MLRIPLAMRNLFPARPSISTNSLSAEGQPLPAKASAASATRCTYGSLSPNRQGNHFVVLTNPGQVGPQSRLPFFRDGIPAVLGAEDKMPVIPGKGMCHSAAPSGLGINALHAPPLPRWATVFRP